MCQYFVEDGCVSDWYVMYLGNLVQFGVGLLILEVIVVELCGCISWVDLGLWDDGIEVVLVQVLVSVCCWLLMLLGIQLGYVGCKVLVNCLWDGGGQLLVGDVCGWVIVVLLLLLFYVVDLVLQELDEVGIVEFIVVFVVSVVCVECLGFELIELYVVYGYLLYQFLLLLSNCCIDGYGGLLLNCLCLLVEVFDVVCVVVLDKIVVGVCIFVSDWVEGGWDLVQSEVLVQVLDVCGCNVLYVFSGGLDEWQKIIVGFGYQVLFVVVIKVKVCMLVIVVGMIIELEQVELILCYCYVDVVVLVCGIFYDLCWLWYVVVVLCDSVELVLQYLCCELCDVCGVFKVC